MKQQRGCVSLFFELRQIAFDDCGCQLRAYHPMSGKFPHPVRSARPPLPILQGEGFSLSAVSVLSLAILLMPLKLATSLLFRAIAIQLPRVSIESECTSPPINLCGVGVTCYCCSFYYTMLYHSPHNSECYSLDLRCRYSSRH